MAVEKKRPGDFPCFCRLLPKVAVVPVMHRDEGEPLRGEALNQRTFQSASCALVTGLCHHGRAVSPVEGLGSCAASLGAVLPKALAKRVRLANVVPHAVARRLEDGHLENVHYRRPRLEARRRAPARRHPRDHSPRSTSRLRGFYADEVAQCQLCKVKSFNSTCGRLTKRCALATGHDYGGRLLRPWPTGYVKILSERCSAREKSVAKAEAAACDKSERIRARPTLKLIRPHWLLERGSRSARVEKRRRGRHPLHAHAPSINARADIERQIQNLVEVRREYS